MREIYIKSKAGLLPIGRRGENLATRVHLSEVPAEGQAVTVYVMRNGDSVAYPASEIEITDTEIIWTVTSVDTGKSGRGKVQYKFSDATTGEIIKTEIYHFVVGLAIDTEVGPAPDPYETWLDSLTDLAGQAQVAAREAEANATQAAESAEQAETSAQNAEQSASQANTYATNAHTSATSATASEASARQSAISAEASAESAQASAESAEASATSAESSARQASASAESASESQTGAETAKQQAYESAQSSQTYSGQSQGYASQAAASATSASQSATAASASATSASQSAQTATAKASEASASATTATTKASEASASATAAQEAQTGAETAQAGAESAAETAQAGADAVGLLREQIYNSYPNVEAEAGSIVSITDGADGIPVKSLVVGIEPVQAGSGDPSPDNVRPITGWTGAIISHSGADVSNPETIPITFPSEAGTVYGGSLDVTNGVLTVDRAIADMGKLIWFKSTPASSVGGSVYTVRVLAIGMATRERYAPNTMLSSAFATAPDSRWLIGAMLDNEMFSNGTNLYVSTSQYDTPEEFKSAMNGVQLVYELATPITYQLTPTEVKTLLGTNNIWADTGDVQEMAYRADTKLYIDGVYEDYQDDLADYADALAALG